MSQSSSFVGSERRRRGRVTSRDSVKTDIAEVFGDLSERRTTERNSVPHKPNRPRGSDTCMRHRIGATLYGGHLLHHYES